MCSIVVTTSYLLSVTVPDAGHHQPDQSVRKRSSEFLYTCSAHIHTIMQMHMYSIYICVYVEHNMHCFRSCQVLGEAFEKHVLTLDSPHITYISFDFHRHL